MRACDYCQLISPPPLTVHHHLIMLARYRLPRDQRAIVAAVTNQAVSAVLEKFVASRSYRALLDPCPGKVASVFAAASPAAEEAVGISFFFLGNRDNFCDRFPEFERCVILIKPSQLTRAQHPRGVYPQLIWLCQRLCSHTHPPTAAR